MPAPTSVNEFLDLVRKSGVLDEKKLDAYVEKLRAAGTLPPDPPKLAGFMVRDGLLTHFQAEQFLLGKWRRFTIGKYKVLERLGSGGMGSVYLCEHKFMRRRVAVKVLPTAKADDRSALERFYREARAVAALDHPNIVRAYDIDQDEKLHFLVMEYVDGASLQEIIKKIGPMEVLRACHYIRQAAMGLQHAHETAGLVHRDIKPGNVLVDRNGIVKVLDMGLARFFHDEEDILTKKYDENVLGTADYLAPEQALDSHTVDIRADIYSLGATFYFLLVGRTPFTEGTIAQKLIWHQTRQPKPIRQIRPEVPEDLTALVEKMMAKDPNHRFQTPLEVAEALIPWTMTPIPPPPSAEMPQLSVAALSGGPATGGGSAPESSGSASGPSAAGTAPPRKTFPPVPGSRPASSPSSGSGPKPPGSGPTLQPPRDPRAVAVPPGPFPTTGPTVPSILQQATAAPTVVAEPPPVEETAPWEQLAPDTDDLTARADTAPRSARKSGPVVATKAVLTSPSGRGLMRFWWVGLVLGGVLLLGTVGVIWWIVSSRLTTPPSTSERKPGPPPRATLKVSQAAPDAYRSMKEALRKANANDRIVIGEEVIREDLSDLDGKKLAANLTIEPAEDLKNPVRWMLPPSSKANQILALNNVEGLTLRGITFDGELRAQDCIMLKGHCPGLTLEEVTVQGFKRSGILITNCAGASARPVTLVKVHAITKKDTESGILFELTKGVSDPGMNQFITCRDCTHTGPSKTPLKYNPSVVKNVELPNWTKK